MNTSRLNFFPGGLLRFETLLLVVLAIECLIFTRTGTNFATQGNALEILKFSVEIGLLALVMTPVIPKSPHQLLLHHVHAWR